MEELKACPSQEAEDADTLEKLIPEIEDSMTLYAYQRYALQRIIDTLRRAAPENKGCADCSGIVYRQTSSGKIIPADQRCGAKITPPCYQPDGDGCAYQIYGDNNDEPIDRCKACPLCYSDKVRHTAPENKPLTIDQLRQMDENTDIEIRPLKPRLWHAFKDGISTGCLEIYRYKDYGKTWLAYARKPEGSET